MTLTPSRDGPATVALRPASAAHLVLYRGNVRWAPSSLVPGWAPLRHYESRFLRGDAIAGITVMAYLIPQVMAYAVLAGLPAQTGLWAAVVASLVYAALGSSRVLSVGPESTTALLTAATLAPLAAGDLARYASLAATLALLCGAFALIGWLVRAGAIADLLSRPVLVGYLAGIAIIMIVSQITRLTGIDTAGDSLVQQLSAFVSHMSWQALNVSSLLLGLGVLIALLLLASRFRRFPTFLAVMLVATAVAWVMGRAGIDVATVGNVPTGLPPLGWSGLSWSDLRLLLLPALGVFVVAYVDNVLTARSFVAPHQAGEQRIDNNQEMLALGVSNVATAAVHGFPISSSASRTAIAVAAGATTQLYSLIAAGSVALVVLLFGGVLAAFPQAALAGVVIYAAIRLIELAEFRRLWHFRPREFLLAVAAVVGVLLFDVLYGILFAIALSIIDLLIRVARPHAAVLGEVSGLAGWHDVGDYEDAETIPGLVVFRYDSPLFFANSEDFTRRALQAIDSAPPPPVRWLLLNVEGLVEVDITGLDALAELVRRCHAKGIVVAIARAKSELAEAMQRHGVATLIGQDRFYATMPTAVDAYREWTDTHGR